MEIFLKAELGKERALSASLQARLDRYENPKNSRNSSISPSQYYSSDVGSLASYLNVRQFIPVGRLKEMFREVFALPICEDALINSIHRVARRSAPAYERIRDRAQGSVVNGADEGRCFWPVQGKLFTFIMASQGASDA